MEKLTNWPLYPAKQQSYWEALLLMLTLLLIWPFLSAVVWCAIALCLSAVAGWQWRQRQQVRILQWQAPQWILIVEGRRRELIWRSGSVRRKHLIIWRYGFWPWQRLIIRPDNLPNGAFRTLLSQLALKSY